MKREGLRRVIAFAISEILIGHKVSIPNVQRYVVPYLPNYRINKSEKITPQDIVVAISMVEKAYSQKPPTFRFGRGVAWSEQRRQFFLRDMSHT